MKRLAFKKMDKRGLPLKHVIAAHRQFRHGKSLSDNLGDGFLYSENPVFRNVRDAYYERGFRFSNRDFCAYNAFPLMSLDDVIHAGKIPYLPNFPWVQRLEKAAPGLFSLTELKRSELKFNYLFHESAHLIAHREIFGRKHPNALPKTELSLLGILLGESFANLTECLSACFTEGEIGAYFLDANCHFRADKQEVRTMLGFARRHGFQKTALVLLGAFLYSNYLYERLGKKELRLLREFAGLGQKAAIRELAQIGLGLSVEFRVTTTPFHLMKTGFREPAALMKRDPVGMLLEDTAAAHALVALLVKGI